MEFNFSPRVRKAIYISNGLISIVAAYLNAKGIIGTPEMIAINAYSVFTSTLATVNVGKVTK